MRISDWSSDVCSAYLGGAARRFSARLAARPRTVANPRKERTMIRAVILSASLAALAVPAAAQPAAKVAAANKAALDRKSVVLGKSVTGSLDHGGRRIIKKNRINE